MDIKEIKRLLDAMVGSDATELQLETGEYKLSIKRGVQQVPVAMSAPALAPVAPPAPTVAPPPLAPPTSLNLVAVAAPIVGTFYGSPSPEAPPFVKVGDRVTPGTVLCIIEAMKLMNEIEAEVAGVIKEILVRNEEPVEYGQVLLRIEPA